MKSNTFDFVFAYSIVTRKSDFLVCYNVRLHPSNTKLALSHSPKQHIQLSTRLKVHITSHPTQEAGQQEILGDTSKLLYLKIEPREFFSARVPDAFDIAVLDCFTLA
jgi:hypothetical protein